MKYKRELSNLHPCTVITSTLATYPLQKSSPDLRSLGVQGNGDAGVHSMLLFDPNNPEEFKTCKQVADKMAKLAIQLGGEEVLKDGRKSVLISSDRNLHW